MNVAERLDPQNAALIVVDVQNDFCHPEGAMAEGGRSVVSMWTVVDFPAPFGPRKP